MHSEIRKDQLDTILAHDEELIPSSGFLSRVMEQVQDEAAAPPPIPFPWKRAVPGMILAVGVLVWAAVEMVRYAARAGATRFTAVHLAVPAALAPAIEQAGWVVAALGVSAAGWLLARRLAGRSGMF